MCGVLYVYAGAATISLSPGAIFLLCSFWRPIERGIGSDGSLDRITIAPMLLLLLAAVPRVAAAAHFEMHRLDPATHPLATCLDGTP